MAAKIAIIGFSGRYPGAKDNKELWKILTEGRDVVGTVPETRWNIEAHPGTCPNHRNPNSIPFGCWLDEPGLFDAPFFNMSPREAPHVDPAQRLALMTAYEALESAGLVPGATPSTKRDRVGVFYGCASNDYGERNGAQKIVPYSIPGACRAFIPGRISHFFKFSGPNYCVDNACASSLGALHLACNAVISGEIDTAVVGGTNIITHPSVTAALDSGKFLSRTGNCKTFDEGADGYCRAEGIVSFVIKRYEDALMDNDPIIALVLGTSTNQSSQAESMTRPHVATQCANMQMALQRAGVEPNSVDYVEMHGTGTQIGDSREMEAVLGTFVDQRPGAKTRDTPLYVGSVKANLGHGESVSGSMALASVLMMLKNETIPPHIGIKTKINPKLPSNLEDLNIHIPKGSIPWPRKDERPHRVLVNNFSAAGNNSTVIIEDAPPSFSRPIDVRSYHVVAVSAKSSTALAANIRSLFWYLGQEQPNITSLSYTTTARRRHHTQRIAVSALDPAEVREKLGNILASMAHEPTPSRPPRVGFAFTGQGSQYLGMGRSLLHFQSFAQHIIHLDDLCREMGFPSVLGFIDGAADAAASMKSSSTTVQLALTCLQIALARLWQTWGVTPSIIVGHSLGEYAALCVAGVITEEDTLRMVGTRAELMQRKCVLGGYSMVVVHSSIEYLWTLPDLKNLGVEFSCKNSPEQIVLSCPVDSADTLYALLTEAQIRFSTLEVPFAFHSSHMDPVLTDLLDMASDIQFKKPAVPVISPTLGEIVSEAGVFEPSYLVHHCRDTVKFCDAILTAKADGIISDDTIWIEIGPHPVVSGLLRSVLGSVHAVPSLHRKRDTWEVLSDSLASLYTFGVDINWAEYHHDFQDCASVLRLPGYNWDLENYWIPWQNDCCLHREFASPAEYERQLDAKSLKRSLSFTEDWAPRKKRMRLPVLPTFGLPRIRIQGSARNRNLCPIDIGIDFDAEKGRWEVNITTNERLPAAIGSETAEVVLLDDEESGLPGYPKRINESNPAPADSWSKVVQIIADVTGVPLSKVQDCTSFANIGLDSLAAIACATRFQKDLGLRYDPTVFFTYPTLLALKEVWAKGVVV